MIPVSRLDPGEQWDQNLLDRLFTNKLYPTGLTFQHHLGYPATPGAVVMIPGRYWAGKESEITTAIGRYGWVLAIRTSDEEDLFDISGVEHPNLLWWLQSPRVDRTYHARLIPLGFPPHFNDLPARLEPKTLNVFLSAQCTHRRRKAAFAALQDIPNSLVNPTQGFTQGILRTDYRNHMAAARIAPCPSGPVTAETFRVYEALESHTIPLADDQSPSGSQGLWNQLFPTAEFPRYTDPDRLPALIDNNLTSTEVANKVTAWWIDQKRTIARALRADLQALGAL